MPAPTARHRAALAAVLAAVLVAGEARAQPAAPPAAEAPTPVDTATCQRIASIRITRLDVFDTSLPEEDKALYRLADALHVKTRESTIRQLLLFQVGEPFDLRLLEETERLMRSAGYLRDATIRPLACPGGEAEIAVVVQDVWTLKPGVSFSRKGGRNSTAIDLEDSNLLGLGTRVALNSSSGVDRSSKLITYRDPLLGGRRLDLSGLYSHNSDGKRTDLALERPFYALDTRWAAGLFGRRENRIDSAYEQGQVVGQHETRERFAKAYAGFSDGLRDGWVTRWAFGWTHDEHLALPIASATLARVGVPADRRLIYPWAGLELVQDQYRETRNLDQIGRTEDLALGWHLKAQLGYADTRIGADRRAWVFDLVTRKGLQPWPGHTLLLDGMARGRVEDAGLAGALFGGTARYYLRQSPRRSVYLALAADHAVRPDSTEQVLLGGDSGLRGYPLRYQSGTGRWVFSAEQRWFTDWYPWRLFNVGGAAFYDMGRVRGQDAGQARLGLLRSLGLGLRLGNSRSGLGNVVHLDLAFPLDGDPSLKKTQWSVETKRSF